MLKSHDTPRGIVTRIEVDSAHAAANMLGDPGRRAVDVYLPHGHDGAELPLLVDLAGFTGSGIGHAGWKNFGENLPERLDRLIATGAMAPTVVAMPDGFTRLGGNQYINSVAMGRWMDALIEEFVPAVEARFGCGGEGRRGLFGKSSGGYGAMVHVLLRPDYWAGAACLSGDMGFELMFAADFPIALRAIDRHGSVEGFITQFEAANKPKGEDIHALMILAMGATYDPDPDGFLGIRLPVTPDTCEWIEERWVEWIKWDPLTLVESHGAGLKRLKALFIDCGTVDQYNLLYGARRVHRRLDELGVAHVYQEFPDNHSGLDYRLDEALPVLARALG